MNTFKNGLLRALDFVFVLRPTLLIPVWLMVLAGYRHGLQGAPRHSLLVVLALISLLAGAIYILNQWADRTSDRINRKLFLIADERIPPRLALAEATLLLAAAAALAFMVAPDIGAAFSAILGAGVLYNFWMKGQVWGGLALNMISYGGVVFIIGWLCAQAFSLNAFLHSLPYWPAIAGVYLLTTLPDVIGDRAAGQRTFGVVFGPSRTRALAAALVVLAAGAGALTRDVVLTLAAMAALPFFVRGLLRQNHETMLQGGKVALVVFALLAGWRFPLFLLVTALTYIGAKAYYRQRFNLEYPYIIGGKI
jgi:4-hydroxybenzoate polyprenyltransferase